MPIFITQFHNFQKTCDNGCKHNSSCLKNIALEALLEIEVMAATTSSIDSKLSAMTVTFSSTYFISCV